MIVPASEEILTMQERVPADNSGRSFCTTRIGPTVLTWKDRITASRSSSSMVWSRSIMIPALLTIASSCGCSARRSASTSATSRSLVTSIFSRRNCTGNAAHSACVSSHTWLRAWTVAITLCPRSNASLAIQLPSPCPAPVIRILITFLPIPFSTCSNGPAVPSSRS